MSAASIPSSTWRGKKRQKKKTQLISILTKCLEALQIYLLNGPLPPKFFSIGSRTDGEPIPLSSIDRFYLSVVNPFKIWELWTGHNRTLKPMVKKRSFNFIIRLKTRWPKPFFIKKSTVIFKTPKLKGGECTLLASANKWILKCMMSLMMTSSFLYRIWNVLLTATPFIIDAGKTKSHSTRK